MPGKQQKKDQVLGPLNPCGFRLAQLPPFGLSQQMKISLSLLILTFKEMIFYLKSICIKSKKIPNYCRALDFCHVFFSFIIYIKNNKFPLQTSFHVLKTGNINDQIKSFILKKFSLCSLASAQAYNVSSGRTDHQKSTSLSNVRHFF